MKAGLIVLFIVLMLAGLAIAIGLGIKYTANMDERNNDVKKLSRKRTTSILSGIVLFIVSLFMMIAIPCQMFQVSSGELAVVRRFGEVVRVEQPGLRMKNMFSETYEIYSTQVQEIEVYKECYSKDLQAVEVKQIIQFRIQAENVKEIIQFRIQAENVKEIAVKYGSLDILKTRIASLSYEAIEESAKSFEAKELVTKRGEFNQAIKDNIIPKYSLYYIDVHQTILSDIMFTKEFEELIQQSKLMEQEIERAEQELKKQLQEAEYKVKIAVQEAAEKVASAQGDADSKVAMAEAEAEVIRKMAQAEADAIRIKAVEQAKALGIKTKMMTRVIGQDEQGIDIIEDYEIVDPEDPNAKNIQAYLEYLAWCESWDGKLPETILSDDVGILFPKP